MAKYCPNCNDLVSPYQEVCYTCGTTLKGAKARPKKERKLLVKYVILGALIPLVGFIMYIFWIDKRPVEARSAGIGAITVLLIEAFISLFSYIYFNVFYQALILI